MYGLSLSPKKAGLGPKHVFQKLPQISYKEVEDFDDMTGIEDILTQRKVISAPEVKPNSLATKKQIDPPQSTPKMESAPRSPSPKPDKRSEQKPIIQQKVEKPQLKGNQMVKMEELKKHCTQEDAWTAIRGEVFDITEYIKRHPGGQSAIKKVMGIDGTKLFGRFVS